MDQTSLVSVCILSKNPGVIFHSVLRSVLAQVVDFKYDVIVVDSGSTDGTLEFIEELACEKVTVYRIPPHEFGHGKTRNYAITRATGKFIAMITHDAQPKDNCWLQNLIYPLLVDSNIAGVFGRHEAYENASIFTHRDLKLHFDNFKNADPVVSLVDKERYSRDYRYRQELHYFSDNNAALRKSVWEKHRYPEVDFAEDQLWAKDIIENGYKKAYADNAIVFHSHNYNFLQTLRRSYDESRALKKLFNYNLCSNLGLVFYQTLICSHRDIRYYKELYKKASIKTSISIVCRYFLKQLGFYLGNNFSKNNLIFRFISLDNSIKSR